MPTDSNTNDAISAAENPSVATLKWFQVKGLNSPIDARECPVYANNYQTTFIEIVIEAVDANGEPVHVSEETLKTIKLVNYNNGAALPTVSYSPTLSEVDELFDLYPGTMDESHGSPSPQRDSIRFYLKTSTVDRLHIAASLSLNGRIYDTFDKNLETGGKVVSGRSNSSAVFISHPQDYTLEHTEFSLKQDGADTESYTRFKVLCDHPKYKIVYANNGNDWDIGNQSNILPRKWWIFSPNKKRTFHDDTHSHANTTVIEINQDPNALYAAILKFKEHQCNIKDEQYLFKAHVQDQYGNSHTIAFRPLYDKIELIKPWTTLLPEPSTELEWKAYHLKPIDSAV
jgi:hypothetical protein